MSDHKNKHDAARKLGPDITATTTTTVDTAANKKHQIQHDKATSTAS
jgi:hypothetical protein